MAGPAGGDGRTGVAGALAALAVVGIFAAVSLFGLWLILPPVLHLVLLTLFAAALGVALWRARRALVPASRNAGLSRLERDSGVAHQPLRALDDQLPSDFRDPATKRLWADASPAPDVQP